MKLNEFFKRSHQRRLLIFCLKTISPDGIPHLVMSVFLRMLPSILLIACHGSRVVDVIICTIILKFDPPQYHQAGARERCLVKGNPLHPEHQNFGRPQLLVSPSYCQQHFSVPHLPCFLLFPSRTQTLSPLFGRLGRFWRPGTLSPLD